MSERTLERLRSGLGDKATAIEMRSPRRIYVELSPQHLVEAARWLFADVRARYAIATAAQTAQGFEVLHHFALDAEHVVVSLRVRAQGDPPALPSLAPVIKAAEFIEREMHDLVGIRFDGHPNLARLILAEDWPEGVYPLRRGRPWEGTLERKV